MTATLLILDTSFILNALKYRVFDMMELRQLAGPARIVVPSAVKRELERLGRSDVADFLLKGGAEFLAGEARFADAEIVGLVSAEKGKVVVATQDGPLRAKLKSFKAKCGLIVVRGKKKLELIASGG
jgi:rRNA-processing protein FCF1